jgi:hypothetical protein
MVGRHAAAVGILAQRLPLAEKQELPKTMKLNPRRETGPGVADGRRPAEAVFVGPVLPAYTVVLFFDRHVERVVVEPVGFALAELGIFSLQGRRGVCLKGAVRCAQ